MAEAIQKILNTLDILTSLKQRDNLQIQDTLRQLEEQTKPLEADKYISYIDLDDRKRAKYQQLKEQFCQQYDRFKLKLKKNQKVFLILGNTGTGKSSFVQKLTNNQNALIGHRRNSCTFECNCFENKEGLKFIDSPGINDTQKERYEILLVIARYLHKNNYLPENIFIICIQNNDLKIPNKIIQEFSYTYFLYQIFNVQLNSQIVKQFIEEYYQSKSLLNWSECNFHQNNDEFFEKRKEIFSNKDLALNYFQLFNSFHIVVKTFFDKTVPEDLEEVDEHIVDQFKEQIWSNQTEDLDILDGYKMYIQNQEQHLFKKIDQIIDLEDKNVNFKQDQQIQNILLIGNSQVGKSSLIEQLTLLKGIRGSGRFSETSACQFYSIDFKNIIYRFIDTPGFDGTEAHQTSTHNLKVIADFLRRNKIIEFKILFLKNSDIEKRDDMEQILKKLVDFIEHMFDRDVSFVDSEYLNHLFFPNVNQAQLKSQLRVEYDWRHQIEFIKDKVLQINRKLAQSKDYNIEEIQKDEIDVLNIKFQSNYFTKKFRFVQVDDNVDQKQQKTLFKAINKLEYISIDAKVICKIKQVKKTQIIENASEYYEAYNQIKERYQNLYSLQADIIQSGQQVNNEKLKQKLQIIQELDNLLYAIVGDVLQIEEIKNFIRDQNHNQSHHNALRNSINQQIDNKLQNDIQRHFIELKFAPILFETKTTSKNTYISRKQHYFCQYSHQLRKFIHPNNKKHQEILEDLVKIKIMQEVAHQQHVQVKCIETLYDRNTEEVLDWIKALVSGLNLIIGTGVQIFRYATFFSISGDYAFRIAQCQEIYKLAYISNLVGSWMYSVIALVSVGIDIYSCSKGQICKKQMGVNSFFNIASVFAFFAFSTIPGIGWFVSGLSVCISLIGRGFTACYFTSSQTFDETISLFLKSIIDDMQPNQSLLYFQKSEFLQKTFQIDKYAQLSQKEGYKMFRQIEVKNYTKDEYQELLLKLFKNPKRDDLRDLISQYIVQAYICNKFQVQFQQSEKEKSLEYLVKISKYLVDNQQLIDTFYNRYDKYDDQKLLKKAGESYIKVNKLVKDKLKYFENQQNMTKSNIDIQLIWDNEEIQIFKQYENSILEFQSQIKQQKYTYQQQKDMGNGYMRKCDRFPILLNSYCNLMQLKTEYLYNQQTISDLSQDEENKCFKVVNSEENFASFFKQEDNLKTIDMLNLLCMTDKYITSRYLQKIEGQKIPNFTCIAENEVIDCKLEYSIDLHELAVKSAYDFDAFIGEIKKQAVEFEMEGDILKRLEDFYQSRKFLSETFN